MADYLKVTYGLHPTGPLKAAVPDDFTPTSSLVPRRRDIPFDDCYT